MWILIAVLVAIPVVVFVTRWRGRQNVTRSLAQYSDRRRESSRVVSRGEFIDGNRRLPVALALTDLSFFYENTDMQASLERQWIHEVEYDDELTTGQSIGEGTVLRLRCFSQKFEFVLEPLTVRQWKLVLPPHQVSEPAQQASVLPYAAHSVS